MELLYVDATILIPLLYCNNACINELIISSFSTLIIPDSFFFSPYAVFLLGSIIFLLFVLSENRDPFGQGMAAASRVYM